MEQEKNVSLSLLAKMDSDHKKMRKEPRVEESELKLSDLPVEGKVEWRGKVPKGGHGGRGR